MSNVVFRANHRLNKTVLNLLVFDICRIVV